MYAPEAMVMSLSLEGQRSVYLDCNSQGSGTQVNYDTFQGAVWPTDNNLAQLTQVPLETLLWKCVEPVAEIILHTS